MRKYELTINGKAVAVQILELSAEEATVEVNGEEISVAIDRVSELITHSADAIPPGLTLPANAPTAPSATESQGSICAPIPGAIIDVYVKVGDSVQAGQPLFKMEAMKMENEINAQVNGTVTVVNIHAGDSVSQGQELILLTPESPNRRKSDK